MNLRFIAAVVPATIVTWGIFAMPAIQAWRPGPEDPGRSFPIVTLADAAEPGDLPESRASNPGCSDARVRAQELLPLAKACNTDDDCFHYPCSCSALGAGPSTDEYLELRHFLAYECGEPIVFAYCGPTHLTCEAGICTVHAQHDDDAIWAQRHPSFEIPPDTELAPESFEESDLAYGLVPTDNVQMQ